MDRRGEEAGRSPFFVYMASWYSMVTFLFLYHIFVTTCFLGHHTICSGQNILIENAPSKMEPAYHNMFIAAGFTEQDINPISDRLIESLLVFGNEGKIRDRVLELLSAGIDALALSLVPVSDATQERVRLARLVGRL
jgi:hypothetical protein